MEKENNNHNHDHNHLQKTVLEKIQAGDIRMRSKSFFVGKMVFVIVLAILILLTSAFFVSFISFSLRVSGRLVLLGFGWQGVKAFLLTFPWGLLLVDLVLIVILERFVRTFKFGYRSPLIFLLGGVAVVVVVAGVAIDSGTSLHSEVWHAEQSGGGQTFFVASLYDNVRQPPHQDGVYRGTIVFMGIATPGGPAFLILKGDDQDSDIDNPATTSEVWKVLLPPNMNSAGNVDIGIGDHILVAGNAFPDGIHAYGIVKTPPVNSF